MPRISAIIPKIECNATIEVKLFTLAPERIRIAEGNIIKIIERAFNATATSMVKP